MPKAIIIARVSDPRQEQEGLSLQAIQLPQYAQDHQFQVVKEFVFQETVNLKVREIIQGKQI